ncbi:MAG: hypothetical protein L0Z48_08400 [candidate division Zixibacteria bacterium]|nr:hypothetical protein [candidate division Zixibacteria bacterium]MCI0596548.1 hypothetical protein [candidate division Zixibacteria bacterium]
MRKEIPLLIMLVCGVFMAVQFFVPHELPALIYQNLNKTVQVVGAVALVLGIVSLLSLHFAKISRRQPGYGYSYILIAFFFMMAASGFLPANVNLGSFLGTGDRVEGSFFLNLYNYVLTPVQATMFALLAFFIASAAFRAFRARSVIATLLLLTAIVVMLGRVPIGPFVLGDWISDLADWIMAVPNAAAKRAVIVGVGLGILSLSLKMVLGIERAWLGGGR